MNISIVVASAPLVANGSFRSANFRNSLLDAAQDRWHKITAPELVPLVRAGATFIAGKLQERRPAEIEPEVAETGAVAA
jgi:hypothetical protein